MTPRAILLHWLNDAACRVSRQRWLHEGVWAAAGLLVLAACYAAIVRFVGAQAVVAALRPLLMLTAIAILVGVVARTWRRPDLAAMAAAADARAGLHDELLSAHWFATNAGRNPFIELHLRRAAHVTGGLDVRRLFPLRVPRNATVVAAVALAVVGGAWLLPLGIVPSTLNSGAATGEASRVAHDDPRSLPVSSGPEAATGNGTQRAAAALWKQLEALAGELSGRPGGQSLAQAVAARDARAAAQALRATQKDTSTQASTTAAPNEQMSDALAQGILDRLAELMEAGEADVGARQGGETDGERPTARLDRELRQEQEDAQRSAPRQPSAGEDALNTSLRALSRTSTGGRDAVHGEADSTQGAGRASVGGGAMGRRVGVSGAGAGEGDQPVGNVAAVPDGDPVLGQRTERLAVQLRAVKVPQGELDERNGHEDPSGTEESFYAATRAQTARAAFESVGGASRSESESALDAERSPLEFRDAVKRYTLARHRREPDPNRGADGAR